MDKITVVDHPLVQHKLTLMRDKDQPTAYFRQLLRETALLLAYEVTRDLPLEIRRIETPIEPMEAPVLAGKKLCFVSVLRAGNGLLEGMLDLLPSARVGHVGLYRDPETLEAVEYYYKVPQDIGERLVIVVDPMLATANSGIGANDWLSWSTRCSLRPIQASPQSTVSSRVAPARSSSSACWRRPKESRPSVRRTRMCRCIRPRSTGNSTITVTFFRVLETPVTASTAPAESRTRSQ